MKKHLLLLLTGAAVLYTETILSQCTATSVAAPDVTLQCNPALGTTNRTGVAFNPALNLYYSVNAGSASYPIETFPVTGGPSVASPAQGADYRGYWWNPVSGVPEGNTFNSGGVYSNALNGSGYATNTTNYMSAATMPNSQACGTADFAGNRVIYYDNGTIYLYNKTSNAFISSTAISGLPAATSNLNMYTTVFTGVPGKELVVYNYNAKVIYFLNIATAAYSGSCSLPASAPASSSFMMGFANNRFFLFEASTYRWYGYPIMNTISASATPSSLCGSATTTLNASGALSYTWSNGYVGNTQTVSPGVFSIYTVTGSVASGCSPATQVTVAVSGSVPVLTVNASTLQTCQGNTITLNAGGALSYTWSNGVANGAAFSATATSYTVTGENACGTSSTSVNLTLSPLPVSASSNPAIVCAGQAATLSAVAAANAYTWSPAVSPNSSLVVNPAVTTVYTVTASNGFCFGSTTLTVTAKPNPTISITPSSAMICNGDAVTLNVSGSAVTYTWNDGQQGLSVTDTPTAITIYGVTGTNSVNCTSSAQQVILVNPVPVVNASASNPLICAADPSTLSASGASTYVWVGGTGTTASTMVVNPSTDQTYTVIGTNSLGCSSSSAVTVSIFVPNISISSNAAICLGASAGLSAGAADSYQWSNGGISANITVSPTLTTVYTVTAYVNNFNGLSCPATNTVEVTVNPKPLVGATGNYSAICIGNSALLTATGAVTYTWTGGTGAIISATNLVMPIFDQTYTVTGTDANGCTNKATYALKVSNCTGIAAHALNTAQLSVYPNPNNGEFVITADQSITLQISNEMGQLVKEIRLDKSSTQVKLTDLANGVYFISGRNEQGIVRQKIIIQK